MQKLCNLMIILARFNLGQLNSPNSLNSVLHKASTHNKNSLETTVEAKHLSLYSGLSFIKIVIKIENTAPEGPDNVLSVVQASIP